MQLYRLFVLFTVFRLVSFFVLLGALLPFTTQPTGFVQAETEAVIDFLARLELQ